MLRKRLKKILNAIPFFRFGRRAFIATQYFNYKYLQIARWLFASREDTNFTYSISPGCEQSLAQMTALVTGVPVSKVKAYIDELKGHQELAKTIADKTRNSRFRNSADLQVHFGKRLGWYAFVRILKPRLVIETGIDKGLGAIVIVEALKRNQIEGAPGRYIGTDINPEAGYLLGNDYTGIGEIHYGDSIESLEKINDEIDLFINDSDHSASYEYREYQTIRNKLSKEAIILGDNSHVTDELSRFSFESGRHFLLWREVPVNHWYPGGGMGVSFSNCLQLGSMTQ